MFPNTAAPALMESTERFMSSSEGERFSVFISSCAASMLFSKKVERVRNLVQQNSKTLGMISTMQLNRLAQLSYSCACGCTNVVVEAKQQQHDLSFCWRESLWRTR
eukprot:scaffold39453_cov23-Cyclotella_meneghiniana.AAC.1